MIILSKEKYTGIELLILFFILLNSFSSTIINLFKNLNIFEIIVSCLLSFALGYLLLSIILKNYNNNLIENISNKKYINNLILLLLVFCAITIGIYSINNTTHIIKDIILPNQNINLISLVLIMTATFLSSKGFKSISIASNLFFIIYFAIIVIIFSFSFPNTNAINLLPINPSINNLNFIELFIYTSAPILLILIIEKKNFNNFKDYKKKIKKTYIIFYLYLIIKVLFIISLLGNKYMSILKYPEITMLKSINIFNFFERLEEILIINIFIENFILISLVFCYASSILNKIFKFKYTNLLIAFFIFLISITIKTANNNILLITNLIFIIINLFTYQKK